MVFILKWEPWRIQLGCTPCRSPDKRYWELWKMRLFDYTDVTYKEIWMPSTHDTMAGDMNSAMNYGQSCIGHVAPAHYRGCWTGNQSLIESPQLITKLVSCGWIPQASWNYLQLFEIKWIECATVMAPVLDTRWNDLLVPPRFSTNMIIKIALWATEF